MLLRTSLAMLFGGRHSRSSQPMANRQNHGGITALTHVRVIDGTGGPPLEDATVVIEGNHIMAVQSAAERRSCRCAGTRFAWRYGHARLDQCPRASGV